MAYWVVQEKPENQRNIQGLYKPSESSTRP